MVDFDPFSLVVVVIMESLSNDDDGGYDGNAYDGNDDAEDDA